MTYNNDIASPMEQYCLKLSKKLKFHEVLLKSNIPCNNHFWTVKDRKTKSIE